MYCHELTHRVVRTRGPLAPRDDCVDPCALVRGDVHGTSAARPELVAPGSVPARRSAI